MACQPMENDRALHFRGGLQRLMLMLTAEGFPCVQAGPGPHRGEDLALADYLEEGGSVKSFNVDNLLLRESMDVIGAPLCPPQWSPACSWDRESTHPA